MRMSSCHPDRKHFCKNLCKNCYTNSRPASKLARRRYEKSEKGKAGRKLSRAISDPGGLRLARRAKKHRALHAEKYKNPDYIRTANLSRRKLTTEQYTQMLESQNYGCAICKTLKHGHNPGKTGGSFAVDHDHTTGQVRGLLCTRCNPGLGFFLDRIDLLQAAIEYLNKYGKF
jgi:hypothetical protein